MGKPLSMDLRSSALAAVDEGMSCRVAARRFSVAAATVIRWHDQRRSTGGFAANRKAETRDRGGPRRMRRSRRCANVQSAHSRQLMSIIESA
jgi:transposase